ncbi:MAG: hypothetical protein HY791_00580 [Deltaproteobacteria bacterium]|nr:hypothetical protein [Deltaproteobacteria bacterium]
MPRSRSFPTVLMLASCSGASFRLVTPADGGAAHVLYAEPAREATAFESLEAPRTFDEVSAVWLLSYDLGLNVLGLSPGPIEPKPCRSCELLAPPRARLAVFDDDSSDAPQWTAAENLLPPDLLELLVPDRSRCDACIEFESRELTLPIESSEHVAAVSVEGRRALVVYGHARAFLQIDTNGEVTTACATDSELAPTTLASGIGSLWVGDAEGRVWRFDQDFASTDAPCSTVGKRVTPGDGLPIVALDAAGTGLDPVFYAITSTSFADVSGPIFRRYSAGSWMSLHRFGAEGSNEWSVLALDADTAIAVTGNYGFARYDHGSIDSRPAEFEAGGPVRGTVLALTRRYGLVMGTSNGFLAFAEPGGRWTYADPKQGAVSARVDAILDRDADLLFTTSAGQLGQWRPQRHYCGLDTRMARDVVNDLVALEGGLVLAMSAQPQLLTPVRDSQCE